MKVLFAPLAAQDIEEIGDWIALDGAKRALAFVSKLRVQ